MAPSKDAPVLSDPHSVDIPNVRFPSLCCADRYAVQVTTTNGTTPFRIEVASLKTQAQWICNVWDVGKHVPANSLYVLPSDVVATALVRALRNTRHIDHHDDCTVDLVHPVSKASYLVLTLTAFGGFSAKYTFELTPLVVPTKVPTSSKGATDGIHKDVLALQQELRTLQNDVLKAQQQKLIPSPAPAHALPMLHLATAHSTPMNEPIRWTVHTRLAPALFALDQDNSSIVLVKTGLYHVQGRTAKKRPLVLRRNGRHTLDPSPCHFFTKKTALQVLSPDATVATAELRIIAVQVFD